MPRPATSRASPAYGCAALPRRSLLGLGAGLMLATGARAADGDYEAMLVNCIDPRFTSASLAWMGAQQMRDRYSQFVVAGGPIGAVHPRFTAWHATFWDNLNITVQLHNIKRVVGLTHRDCGAARLAFGAAGVATPAAETASHAEALAAFRAEVGRRKPGLGVVTGIMALDGSVALIG
ncbi:hypothetical protein GCM10011504_11080 [Siccirubricoccus deserti]|uniref:Carbonic anhydrase n=1 Tax=Siccirubricoccus deserti TaxID=2013562 RepID=A0A9X0QWV2_9PROT|nr:hypothetical protein [Siccirubricoccus deserti]MBC4014723.1 hypothetical protein [Siccirubricoccus deserti]GGC34491.1 hypothetical protein GCM10011504_11080 [Siccirubricoccus deserti]